MESGKVAVTGCHSAEESWWAGGLVVGGWVREWPSQSVAGGECRGKGLGLAKRVWVYGMRACVRGWGELAASLLTWVGLGWF